jgi:glycogen operon protein
MLLLASSVCGLFKWRQFEPEVILIARERLLDAQYCCAPPRYAAPTPALAASRQLIISKTSVSRPSNFCRSTSMLTRCTLCSAAKNNYWKYNSIGFFAPECSYSSSGATGGQVTEFKQMVKNLHRAGIEVILDVVYNHSAEGNHLGPTFCFKGIENVHYYRLVRWDPRYYVDYSGCGNTLDATKPRVLQMITDSLRYWITEMHVDGFRFDLAASLARGESGVSKFAAFFENVHQDPVISRAKLIAGPWDLGEGDCQVGNFPVLWAEWNGRYRDSVRRFWKGDPGLVGEIACRLSGSSDLYQSTGKRPYASINFITSHDGLTLNDLVSYNEKHNEANGEGNRDGENNNNSWNCGSEGPTTDEAVNALRDRQRRNFLATLFLSQCVPMLCAGDEFCRTQNGNNNAYCQDNEISWLSWEHDARAKSLLIFTQKLLALRRAHPIFRRPKFFEGRPIRGANIKDIMWFSSTGAEMSDAEWDLVMGLSVSAVPNFSLMAISAAL